MEKRDDRRPLASRKTRWAKTLARCMVSLSLTPNFISQSSIIVAALSGAAFFLAGQHKGLTHTILLICAALFCQLRLLCNLLDGMIAIEGGKGKRDGPFWNEFPDRIADVLILIGVGYGIDTPSLGWAASSFAILTAYIRELGHAIGVPSDFSGPMAKPHRMATITLAALLSIVASFWNAGNQILIIALWSIIIGSALTTLRRARHLLRQLKN